MAQSAVILLSAVIRCCKKNGLKNITMKRAPTRRQFNRGAREKEGSSPVICTAMEEYLLSLAVETAQSGNDIFQNEGKTCNMSVCVCVNVFCVSASDMSSHSGL